MPRIRFSHLRSFFSRLIAIVTYPWRIFQERTSVQLIAGYVAVVLIVIMLFQITVETLVSQDLSQVYADRDRICQIIYNALRHTPEGGLIIIQARMRGEFVEIEVSDTVIGIAEEKLETLFSRYYRTEQTRRSGAGSGLGLAIVEQMVKAHGGEITVSTVVGQGTAFRFTLPQVS